MKEKIIIICNFFLLGLSYLFYFFLYITKEPQIEISKVEYPPLKMIIKTSRINTIISIDFFSTKENKYVWGIFINRSINQITFGNVPHGCQQTIPFDDKPPRSLANGEKIIIKINYQYDYLFSPSGGTKTWSLEIVNDKEVIMHGETKVKLPFFPIK